MRFKLLCTENAEFIFCRDVNSGVKTYVFTPLQHTFIFLIFACFLTPVRPLRCVRRRFPVHVPLCPSGFPR